MVTTSSLATEARQRPAFFVDGPRTLRNFLRHRDLLWQMVGNDLRGRYVGSALGVFWNLVHPLVQIAIYMLVFSRVMNARLSDLPSPYAFSIYLCAGLLPWMTSAEVITRCTGLFWEHAHLVKKIAFPKLLLYAYVTVAAVTNLAVMVALFFGFLWLVDALPSFMSLLVWIPLLLLQVGFCLGIGFATSVLNVFFRDIAQITNVLLQLWFWLTPIVYVPTILPSWAPELLRYNIMAYFTISHQRLMVYGECPDAVTWGILVTAVICSLGVGMCVFLSLRRRVPDEL